MIEICFRKLRVQQQLQKFSTYSGFCIHYNLFRTFESQLYKVERRKRRHNLASYMQTFKLFQLHRGNSKAAILFILSLSLSLSLSCIPFFFLSFFPPTFFSSHSAFFSLFFFFALRHTSHKWGTGDFSLFSPFQTISLYKQRYHFLLVISLSQFFSIVFRGTCYRTPEIQIYKYFIQSPYFFRKKKIENNPKKSFFFSTKIFYEKLLQK